MRHPNRREILRLIGRSASAAGLAPLLGLLPKTGRAGSPGEGATPPSIVFIMTDDQGYGDLGCYGSTEIATPRIDRMASEGVRLTDYYTASSCVSARVGFMTGSYQVRAGNLKRAGRKSRNGLHRSEVTLAELLKQAGYRTHLVGKWHLGSHPDFSPLYHGFDDYFGLISSNGQNPPLMRGHAVVDEKPDQSELIDLYTKEVQDILVRDSGQPSFIFLSHAMPHVPLSSPERFRGQSKRGPYGDAVEAIDWSTGAILDTLAALGQADRTLLVLTSDNGPWTIKGKAGGSAGPFSGGKGEVFEGALRVPCIVRWPGTLPAATECSGLASVMDWLPSFATVAGAALPDDRVIDGLDIGSMLRGAPTATSPHDALYFFYGERLAAVRGGPWKLHLALGSRSPRPRLYDVTSDPAEHHDLAAEHPAIVERLEAGAEVVRASLAAHSRPLGRVGDVG